MTGRASPEPTVSIRLARLIVATVKACGVSSDEVFARSGLDQAVLRDDEARIPVSREAALWSAGTALCRDPHFGLRAAAAYRPGQFDVFDYVCRSAPSVRGAIERSIRYNRLLHDTAELRLEERGPLATVIHRWHGDPAALSHEAEEYTLGVMVSAARSWSGGRFTVRSVSFRHPRPADIAPLVSFFGTDRLTFGAADGAVTFERALLDMAMPAADPGLCSVLERHADALLSQLPRSSDFPGRVRELIASSLRDGAPTAEDIARALHLSARTLQRRLADAETSFGEELESVRKGLAARFLQDRRIAIADVAFLLGYSEARAFHRAFKSWTGQTPGQWRERAEP